MIDRCSELLSEGLSRTHDALRDLRFMRGNIDLWAQGPANLLLTPTLNAYRLMRMLKEREEMIKVWHAHTEGIVWSQTALPAGRWERLRAETAEELLDTHGGEPIMLTPIQWAMQEEQIYARMSEEAEAIRGGVGDRRTTKVSRLYASVFFRSAEGYQTLIRQTEMARAGDGA
jgi:hypothetical protein